MSIEYNDWFYNSAEFQAFFKNSTRSTVIKANDPNFTIIAVSEDYLQLSHRSRADLLNQKFFDIFPGNAIVAAQQNSLFQSFQRVIENKTIDVLPLYEYQIFLPDKAEYVTQYWSNINEPILDPAGNVAYIIRTVTNITDKILSEQALEESDELKASLQRERVLNEELAASNEELHTVNDALHDSREKLLTLTNELEERVALRTKDLATANEQLAATIEEIASTNEELQQAQDNYLSVYAELKKNQADLLFTIEAAGLATWDLNPLTGHFSGNDVLRSWFGLAPDEEIPLQKATDVIAEADRGRVVQAIAYALQFQSGGMYNIEYAVSNPNAPTPRIVKAKGKAQFNDEEEAIRLSGTLQDITEQKRDEKRKNDFIGMVSHEMKTPLTSLSAYLQVLQMDEKSHENMAANLLSKASRQVGKMTTLINGFLNVTRLESGKIQINKQRFDMAQLVKEAEDEILSLYSSHRIVFHPVKTTYVNADRDKIGQVISNLISNAVKYASPGTEINVSCLLIDGSATVSVTDQGIGISEEDRPKLFERYYRVNSDSAATASGFGIGLYLCAEIIQHHDGKIWVESEVGKGSTFSFSIPIVD